MLGSRRSGSPQSVVDRDRRAEVAAILRACIRDYAAVSQKVNAGRLLAPAARPGIVLRNLLFSSLSLVGPLMTLINEPASKINLKGLPHHRRDLIDNFYESRLVSTACIVKRA